MKRTKRIIALILVFLLCFSLCGCNVDIDKLRARHGVWDAERNIVLNGVVYKPLPSCDMLAPNTAYTAPVYVAEEDVPLLLVEENGDSFSPSTDGVFLVANEFYATNQHYCRSDRYDEVVQQIENLPEMSTYRYTYETYDEDGLYTQREYTLTEEEAAVFEAVLDTAEFMTYEMGVEYNDGRVRITCGSENGWFKSSKIIHVSFMTTSADTAPTFMISHSAYFDYYAVVEGEHAMAFAALMSAAVEGQRSIDEHWEDE